MTLYVFDTDHLSLYGRNHPVLIDSRLREATPTIATTVDCFDDYRN
jgi:tRNA(fMet)-specific endonuclease VapC